MPFGWVEAGVGLLVLLTVCLVLFVFFLAWRDGYSRGWQAARIKPPTCLACGYNLSGLTQCRCPECGTEYRLDELWQTHIVSKPSRSEGSPAAANSQRQQTT